MAFQLFCKQYTNKFYYDITNKSNKSNLSLLQNY